MHRTRAILAALALALLAAAPAHAAAPAAPGAKAMSATSCSGAQPFLPFGDAAAYTAAVNGGFELGTTGWDVSGAAAVVSGNEPWQVAGAGTQSLELRDGAKAAGSFVCPALTKPAVRFFARNLGARKAGLRIELLYRDAAGVNAVATTGNLVAGAAWGVTPAIGFTLPAGSTITGIRLAPQGVGGIWQVDDVYVDPYRRV